MTKLEALEYLEHKLHGYVIEKEARALYIAIDCIQHCIDEEDDPCYDCDHSHCNNCLYSGRIPN